MLSEKQLTQKISIVMVELQDASRLAREAGYPMVDFGRLLQRLRDLKNALAKRESDTVSNAMAAINGSQPRSAVSSSNSNVIMPRTTPKHQTRTRPIGDLRAEAGSKGGLSKSAAKQKAARENGRHGGRPKNHQAHHNH